MVELIDDHHVEGLGVEFGQAGFVEDWTLAKTSVPARGRSPPVRRSPKEPSFNVTRKMIWLCSKISVRWATKSRLSFPRALHRRA